MRRRRYLPGGEALRVGIVAFDTALHFYAPGGGSGGRAPRTPPRVRALRECTSPRVLRY